MGQYSAFVILAPQQHYATCQAITLIDFGNGVDECDADLTPTERLPNIQQWLGWS